MRKMTPASSLRPWLFLFSAVLAEVIGVVCMKLTSEGDSFAPIVFVYTMVGLSFYFLAIAVKQIPIALAYAAWEASGLTLITIVGILYFGEELSVLKLFGVATLITGVVLLNFDIPTPTER